MSNDLFNLPTHYEVITELCPWCDASPGVPCYGSRGRPRTAFHVDRWKVAQARVQSGSLVTERFPT